jgi:2',3'-cyclic-nucleotide 2'-phosphodiesterase (5'-nucleotidase family)
MIRFSTSSSIPRLRIAAVNDVYELKNLPRVQTFLRQLQPMADVVSFAGDFLSPSPLSALDGGKGMVTTLRALGMTHLSLGNHEADLKLPKLKRRLAQLQRKSSSSPMSSRPILLNSNVGIVDENSSSAEDWAWMSDDLARYDLVTTPCGRVTVAMMGLLSDDRAMFRDGTFRGAPIGNILDAFSSIYAEVVHTRRADWLLPLTHQTIERDQDLARHMLTIQPGPSIVIGGHEHTPSDVRVEDPNNSNSYARIFKSGSDATAVSLIDIYFDVQEDDKGNKLVQVGEIDYSLVDIQALAPSMVVQNIVDTHQSLLTAMENEDVLHADSLLPPGIALSSEGTRIQQTSLGGILCTCIREEVEADVAILNGAVIKGNATYPRAAVTYAQIRQELPFPTKIVVVPMKRWELQTAVEYSRNHPIEGAAPEEEDSGKRLERRGYLQVDLHFDQIGFHTGDQEEELQVALPRNLLNGFCKIQPLMDVGERLKEQNIFPAPDDFVPALDLVIRHSSKGKLSSQPPLLAAPAPMILTQLLPTLTRYAERWYELIDDNFSFADLDPDAKGYLNREDVARILRGAIEHEPPEFLIDDMMSAIDFDDNGVIDPGELSHLLAEMEREHGLFRFDD